jgi:hypothetical protein
MGVVKEQTRLTWSDAIIEVLKGHNFIATLKTLQREAPQIYSKHNIIVGKTPFKTINERVQRDKRIYKLAPGLYTLTEKVNELPRQYNPKLQTKGDREDLNHISVQALLLQLGQIYNFNTYTPDKSKNFVDKPLSSFVTLNEYPGFTYKRIIDRVRNIDVAWFNKREFPANLFEVENTSDIKNALSKFMELIDFKTRMTIVGPKQRESEYLRIMQQPSFKPLMNQTNFWSYETVEKLFNSEKEIHTLRSQLIQHE